MTLDEFTRPLTVFWQEWGAAVLLGAGVIGLFALVLLYAEVRRSKRPLRPLALAFSMNLALLLNAEGMWVVATDPAGMNLPKLFAVLVFAVFEICFLTATSLAAEQYRRTTVYAPDGKVVTPGHPGPMLWIAALIAVVSGVIVASNAHSGTERMLRLAVPAVIFLMWWAALTAAGQKRRRSRFAYSLTRVLERRGLMIPDEDPDFEKHKAELARLAVERQARRMVINHQRASAKRWPRSLWKSRLLKNARSANQAVVDEVVAQLARIDAVMALLGPEVRTPGSGSPDTGDVPAQPAGTSVPQVLAVRDLERRVYETRLRRRARTAHRVVHVRTVQEPRRDPRSAQEKASAIRAIQTADPARSVRDMARLVNLPASTVQEYLSRTGSRNSGQQTNGKRPILEGVSS